MNFVTLGRRHPHRLAQGQRAGDYVRNTTGSRRVANGIPAGGGLAVHASGAAVSSVSTTCTSAKASSGKAELGGVAGADSPPIAANCGRRPGPATTFLGLVSDALDSDWPLRISFRFHRQRGGLLNPATERTAACSSAGDPFRLSLPQTRHGAQITLPDGASKSRLSGHQREWLIVLASLSRRGLTS